MNQNQQNAVLGKIESALRFIKLRYPLFERIRSCQSQAEAEELNEDFKGCVKHHRRTLAKRLHPDLFQGKAAVVNAERMKQVNAACDFLMSVELSWMPPRPHPSVIQFAFSYGDAGTATSYSTSGTTHYWRMG